MLLSIRPDHEASPAVRASHRADGASPLSLHRWLALARDLLGGDDVCLVSTRSPIIASDAWREIDEIPLRDAREVARRQLRTGGSPVVTRRFCAIRIADERREIAVLVVWTVSADLEVQPHTTRLLEGVARGIAWTLIEESDH